MRSWQDSTWADGIFGGLGLQPQLTANHGAAVLTLTANELEIDGGCSHSMAACSCWLQMKILSSDRRFRPKVEIGPFQ
jgi:hypothetical protein